MAKAAISIPVDAETASAYLMASPDYRKKQPKHEVAVIPKYTLNARK